MRDSADQARDGTSCDEMPEVRATSHFSYHRVDRRQAGGIAPLRGSCPRVLDDATGRRGGGVAEHGGCAGAPIAEELAQLDQQKCPVCGITFHDFRSQGRLGCPHDYIAFEAQLEPLLLNIHGENEHIGKIPKRCPQGSEKRTQLIRLRREMADAVTEENYERAKELRDEIQHIESSGGA